MGKQTGFRILDDAAAFFQRQKKSPPRFAAGRARMACPGLRLGRLLALLLVLFLLFLGLEF